MAVRAAGLGHPALRNSIGGQCVGRPALRPPPDTRQGIDNRSVGADDSVRPDDDHRIMGADRVVRPYNITAPPRYLGVALLCICIKSLAEFASADPKQ